MKENRSLLVWFALPLCVGVLLAVLLGIGYQRWQESAQHQANDARIVQLPKLNGSDDETAGGPKSPLATPSHEPTQAEFDAMLDALLRQRTQSIGAIENEAVIRFANKAAYEAFLNRAAASGLKVFATLGDFNAVRVGYGDIAALRRELSDNLDSIEDVAANYPVKIPELAGVPEVEARTNAGSSPIGDSLFAALGAEGDRSQWGRGVTVAVLDAGLTAHPAFAGTQVTHVDLVKDGLAFDGHGDAMGSLIAGSQPGAQGLAPAASLLDVRILDGSGEGNSFTLAQGIQYAVDHGAQIINISGASYGDAAVVRQAINYAREHGTLVVAAVGNEQAGIKAYPAAYEGVVAVSAVDSKNKLAYFSNSGDPTLAAPGVGVPSAYSRDGQAAYVYGSGTSQSSALVSGAAAVLLGRGQDPASTLTRYTRAADATATTHQVGAGVLYLGVK